MATGVVDSLYAVNALHLAYGYDVHVDDWTACTDGAEWPGPFPFWPMAGSSLFIRWDPGHPFNGPDQVVVIGALHVRSGSMGRLQIQPPGPGPEIFMADGHHDPRIFEDDCGVVDVDGGGWGYNPCRSSTPVVGQSWGRLKALYR